MEKRNLHEEKRKHLIDQRKLSLNPKYPVDSNLVKSSTTPLTKMLPHSNDIIFNKLSEKIVSQVRDEIRKEMNATYGGNDLKDVVSDRMDSYLRAELHTHTCKICLKLMQSPSNTPMLLFPCGHTFCQSCLSNKVDCPYCKQQIESLAVNQSLKLLIDHFVSKREMVSQI